MSNQIRMPRKGKHNASVRPLWKMLAAVILLGGLAFCSPAVTAFATANPLANAPVGPTVSPSASAPVRPTVSPSANPPVGPTANQAANPPAGPAANQAVTLSTEEPVVLEVSYGYENAAKGGRYLPLNLTITNRQSTPLSGTIQIKSMESDRSIYRYDYPLAAEPLTRADMQYFIPLGTRADRLFLTLTDDSGNTVLNKRVKLNVSLDVPELFIGILADRPETLRYLNGVGIHYSSLRTRTFPLQGEDFPEEEIGLDLLDVIIVNDYKLRSLSEKQTAAIMDWVHNGGVLILGTGDGVDDTLGRFAPELLDASYGTPEIRAVNMGNEFAMESPDSATLEITCVDIPLHGGNVIFSSREAADLTAAAKERGMIAVAAYDLADIGEFCEAQPAYVDKFFTNLLGEDRIDRLAKVVYSGNSSRYWSVQSLINTGDVDKLPNLGLYTAVVVIYLLLLGPVLYLFLKNREMQIYYRRGVVLLSVGFSVIIYLMGTRTRFQSTFYTYASIQDVTEDYVTDTTYVNIRNPYNRTYTSALNPSYSVLPITRSYGSDAANPEFTGDENFLVGVSYREDRTEITGQNVVAFDPRYFRLERKSENVDKIGITGEVDYFEGILTGSITNNFPFPLENATLILYGNLVMLDRLEAGETKSLDELDLLRFPLNNFAAVAEWVINGGQFKEADIDDKEYLLAMERSNLLIFYLENYMSGYSADARVIAFSTEKEESQFLKEALPETYGLTMLTSSVAVNASRASSLYRSVLMKKPEVTSGTYTAATNSMNGNEPVTLEYYLGTDINVESLTFEPISQAFLRADNGTYNGTYIAVFTGSIYFYNVRTGSYDPVKLDGGPLELAELSPYLSQDNALTVRYVYSGTGSYGEVQLPMPMVAGRER